MISNCAGCSFCGAAPSPSPSQCAGWCDPAFCVMSSCSGCSYCGASLLAMAKLGVRLGYTLVYCESHGVNAFFVRNDVLGGALPGLGQVEQEDLDALLRVERIYRRANYFGKGWHYQPLDPDQMAREGKAWVWV